MQQYNIKMMNSKQYDEMVKFILVGNTNVGKTSVMRKFCEDKFNQNQRNTVGLDYGQRIIDIAGKKVLIQIWDTAGQEQFRTLTPSYYRSAMGIFLVYSMTDKNSFNSVELWMKQIKQFTEENIPILILANKADTNEKEVSEQQARGLSERHESDFLMTSAKLGINIQESMIQMYTKISKERKVEHMKLGSKEDKEGKENSVFCKC